MALSYQEAAKKSALQFIEHENFVQAEEVVQDLFSKNFSELALEINEAVYKKKRMIWTIRLQKLHAELKKGSTTKFIIF